MTEPENSASEIRKRGRVCSPSHMQVRVGKITAKCPECGGSEFTPLRDSPVRYLACRACGATTTRPALLDQIAEEALREARSNIEQLRRQNPKKIA